jgi:hypothetical protein
MNCIGIKNGRNIRVTQIIILLRYAPQSLKLPAPYACGITYERPSVKQRPDASSRILIEEDPIPKADWNVFPSMQS